MYRIVLTYEGRDIRDPQWAFKTEKAAQRELAAWTRHAIPLRKLMGRKVGYRVEAD